MLLGDGTFSRTSSHGRRSWLEDEGLALLVALTRIVLERENSSSKQIMLKCNMSYSGTPPFVSQKGIHALILFHKKFTIHGRWAANASRYGLTVPTPESPNDHQIVIKDMALMTQDQNLGNNFCHVWPSVVRSFSNEGFWKYEWEAHGFGKRTQIDFKTYFEAATWIHATKIATNGKTTSPTHEFNLDKLLEGRISECSSPHRGINIKCYNNGTHNFF
ncbi:hypothetical protein RND71_039875 [Anisodus tanguticus]|uniref:Uncharacterized protein n=1 Tax=Anisodus tanguticus TaxID=243964 RepID=A0AAE1QY90_9SOLA|nr:hypothetical protein RND71_039875 [Anisodus tanguticus]